MNPSQPVCPKCHTAVRPGARFCPSCGSGLPQQPSVPPIAASAPRQPAAPLQVTAKKKSRAGLWVLIVVLLCILLTACLVLVYFFVPGVKDILPFSLEKKTTATLEETLTETSISGDVTETPEVTEIAVVTELPTVAPTEAPPTGYFVSYNNVEFTVPEEIALSAKGKTFAAVTVGAYWEMLPEYDRFSFDGYVLENTFHDPVINILPVQEYIDVNPDIADTINSLKQLLDNPTDDPGSIPFLPAWNAAEMFVAKVNYLEFNGIRGVSFLTQFGQSFWPINSHDMFYTFQGLTNDEKYYISIILPVSHPMLPATGEDYTGSMDELMSDYDGYLADTLPLMESWSNDEFTPSLDGIEALIKSIKIK